MEKLWNSNYKKVMTANFMLFFAFYLLTPLLPLYLSETFGTTKDVIGVVLFGYTVAALITRPFCGYIVDSFARKKVLFGMLQRVLLYSLSDILLQGTLLMFCHRENTSRSTFRSRKRCQIQTVGYRRASIE
jgi:MFS family permease